jgi:hypothetical protein
MSITSDLELLKKKANVATVSKQQQEKPSVFFQATVIYKSLHEKRNILDKPFYISTQYVSPEIFLTEVEVTQFMPYFVKRLITDKIIGEDAVLPDKTINFDICSCGAAPLKLTQMIRNDD